MIGEYELWMDDDGDIVLYLSRDVRGERGNTAIARGISAYALKSMGAPESHFSMLTQGAAFALVAAYAERRLEDERRELWMSGDAEESSVRLRVPHVRARKAI